MNITEVDNRSKLLRLLSSAISISLIGGLCLAMAQTPSTATHPVRPTPPTRDPHASGYVAAKELPDGTNPPANADGNFIIGPTYDTVPEMSAGEGLPQGAVFEFTMDSTESKMYPGIARSPVHLAHPIRPTQPDYWSPPATPLPTPGR